MLLRLLIAAQLAWVAFTGSLYRGLLPDVSAAWVEWVVEPTIQFGLFGFPALFVFAVRRQGMPEWRCWLVGLLQAGLSVAALLAVSPAVQ